MSHLRIIVGLGVLFGLMSWCGAQEKLPRQEWGAPLVAVTREGGVWQIAGQKQIVTLDASNLAIRIKAGSANWAMVPSGSADMIVRLDGKDFPLRLADAGKIEVTPYDTGFETGVKITLGQWRHGDQLLDISLVLTAALQGKEEDLVFDAAAVEGQAVVRQLDWPTAVDGTQIDCTLLSNHRGVLLPTNWPKPYFPDRATNPDGSAKESDTSVIQSNVVECWSMSWWGFQRGQSAMMVIVQTPDDAAYQFDHPAGGPTVIGPRWRASLGRFSYPRSCRMCFFEKGNYVDMAKRYRQYAIDRGIFISLKEKIAQRPVVGDLIGTPMTRLSTLVNIVPDSKRFNTTQPAMNHHLVTFDQRAEQLRKLKEQGIDRLSVVVTGWPHMGYDRQHPDELPPAPGCGWSGWAEAVGGGVQGIGVYFQPARSVPGLLHRCAVVRHAVCDS